MAHEFHMLESKKMILFTYLFVGLLLSCQPNNKVGANIKQDKLKMNIDSGFKPEPASIPIINKKKIISETKIGFIPDSTINRKLKLNDYESLSDFYFDYKNILTVDRVRECPVVIFSDASRKQYLLAYHYEGDAKNAFNCFEIGYFDDEKNLTGKQIYKTEINKFKTESNLHLGMSFKDLIIKKGGTYKIDIHNNTTLITYNVENTFFVKRHNMPGYFMKFFIVNDIVHKITFGFYYP
jgi:hypothetical protein